MQSGNAGFLCWYLPRAGVAFERRSFEFCPACIFDDVQIFLIRLLCVGDCHFAEDFVEQGFFFALCCFQFVFDHTVDESVDAADEKACYAGYAVQIAARFLNFSRPSMYAQWTAS